MASISPTSVQCSPEQFTAKHGYIKLTITSISDSDATTNQRYIGWKLTVEGTHWVQLSVYYCSLGGVTLAEKYTNTTSWSSGQILASNTTTFNNDSAGNLSLYAYVKQLFYYDYSDDRWSNPNRYQEAGTTMVCSQLPRYANFTSHYVSNTTLNTLTVHWEVDSNCDIQQYSLNGGAWTNCSWPNYTISGLSPGTQYNIRTRVRRTDSQLYTTSGYIYGTTASLPASNTPANFDLGNKPSISIANTNYLSKWYYKIYDGDTEIYSSPDITSTSHNAIIDSSNIINEMLNRHPNDNSWSLNVRFWVVSNGTTYELTQRNFTCTIPSDQYAPLFNADNISYALTDSLSNNITGSTQKVIKGISDIQVTCTAASPQGGSSMKSYNATSGSKTASTTNLSSIIMDLTDVDGSSVTVLAVDTRNRTANATKPFAQYVEYSKVNISTSNITRYDGIGQNLVFNIVGSFYKWSGLAVNNAIQAIQYQYKLKGQPDSSYSSPINITGVTHNDNVFTVNSVSSDNHFDTDKEYTVKISITDRLATVSYTTDIPTGKALIWKDLLNKLFGIGKKPDISLPNGSLDVLGDLKVGGNISADGNIAGIVSGDTLPIGSQVPFSSLTIPDNWLLCDGRAISRADYSELFAVIGTSYGAGNGTTTFNLPNKKGRASVGFDSSQTEFNVVGCSGGEKTHQLTVEELPKHRPHIDGMNNEYSQSYWDAGVKDTSFGLKYETTSTFTTRQGSFSIIGNDKPHNNLQPYQTDVWIIKAKQSAGVVATVVDTLDSTSATNALSAGKGKDLNDRLNNLLDMFYPVGTIYETTSADLDTTTKMDSHFGGTWEVYGAGRVLVAKSTDAEFNSLGKTGGEKTHTLTVPEMPSHNHYIPSKQTAGNVSATEGERANAGGTGSWTSYNNITSLTGGGQAHNNLQPYIVVYRYRRTA